MSDTIKHEGKVEKILDDTHLQVRIVQSSACASCKIASHCTSAESKEKIIDVWTRCTAVYSVGQDVTVLAAAETGRNAVIIGFVVPVILILATVVGMMHWLPEDGVDKNQAIAAISGLAILIPYYITLYFFRDILKEKFSFRIE